MTPTAQFQPAHIDEFTTHHRQFGKLLSPGGVAERAWAIINAPEAYDRMVVANDALDLPAIAGVAKELAPLLATAQNEAERKQLASAFGGMVRTVLVRNGRKTSGVKRAVPPLIVDGDWQRVFKTGEVYV